MERRTEISPILEPAQFQYLVLHLKMVRTYTVAKARNFKALQLCQFARQIPFPI